MSSNPFNKCQWCGMMHGGMCPSVKAIEYDQYGEVRRVEFKTAPDYTITCWPPLWFGQFVSPSGEIKS